MLRRVKENFQEKEMCLPLRMRESYQTEQPMSEMLQAMRRLGNFKWAQSEQEGPYAAGDARPTIGS